MRPEESAASAQGLSDEAAARFARLRVWRLDAARAQGVPPYVIFHDAHLAEIARRAPQDIDELGQIPGVGATKLKRYGETLLDALLHPQK